MGLGSGIRKKPIPDPWSRGHKGTGSRSATLHWCGSGSCFSLWCGSGSYLSLWFGSGSYLSILMEIRVLLFTSMRTKMQLFILMRIRIQLPKMMRIRNTGSYGSGTLLCRLSFEIPIEHVLNILEHTLLLFYNSIKQLFCFLIVKVKSKSG